MSKTEVIRARIEPELKKEVESTLAEIGLNTSESINLFFRQIRLQHGVPFPVKIPNKKTVAAMEESTEKLPRFESVDELMDELDSK